MIPVRCLSVISQTYLQICVNTHRQMIGHFSINKHTAYLNKENMRIGCDELWRLTKYIWKNITLWFVISKHVLRHAIIISSIIHVPIVYCWPQAWQWWPSMLSQQSCHGPAWGHQRDFLTMVGCYNGTGCIAVTQALPKTESICTHIGHPMPHPYSWAMWCPLWGFSV